MIAQLVPAVVSALFGGVAGSLGTYILRERSRRKERERQITNMRRSLLAELHSMEELATQDSANKSTMLPMHRFVSAEVYRANSSQISLLTEKETEAIVRFYSGAIKFEQTLEVTRGQITEETQGPLQDFSGLHHTQDILREEWKECVLALMSELDRYPKEIEIDGETLQIDESRSSGDLWVILDNEEEALVAENED